MKTEKERQLETNYNRIANVGYCLTPYEDLSEIIHPDAIVFGTAKDEHLFTFEQIEKLFKAQYEQMNQVEAKIDRNRIATRFSLSGDHAEIIELVNMKMVSTEMTVNLELRTSGSMEYINGTWMLTHWHASTAANTENDPWHLEEWRKERETLQNLVNQQTEELLSKNRDLEIEAALERIRARSSAMQHTDELSEVITLIFKILDEFHISVKDGVALITFSKGSKDLNEWMANPGFESAMKFNLPYFDHPVLSNLWKAKNNGEKFLIHRYSAEENKSFLNHIFEHSDFKFTPQPVKEYCLAAETYATSIAFQKHTAIFINDYSGISLNPIEIDLLERFSTVFEQTYTRFLDIQKAEQQARESKIELALERIRTQVTVMQESSDLFDIVVTMREEFLSLDHEADYFWHMRWLADSYEMSMTSEDGSRIGMVISIPSSVHENIPGLAQWEKGNDPTYVLALDSDHAWDYIENMNTYGQYELLDPDAPTREDIHQIGGLTFVIARTTHGEIGFSLPGVVPEPPEEALDTLVRFAGVFDLAYKRFLDLEKAEERVRDIQIKNSLEKVRSRSLAMYKTTELTEIISTVNQQFKELNVDISGGAFIVINKELEDGFYCWGAGGVGNYVRKVLIPFIDRPIYHNLSNGIKSGKHFFTEYYDVDEKRAFFTHLFNHAPFDATPKERQELLLSSESGYGRSCVVSNHTSIFIINHNGKEFSDEENGILRQMGRVFEQAYTRFLDLQKAELQARQIKEERDRLEITLKELKSTQAQLIQQEKLASLGQLTAGIAHEIKNPLNFVNNFSDLSRELIEEILEERTKNQESRDESLIDDILEDIKSNLQRVHEHGTRANGIVTSMLQHSRASSSKREAKAFNPLVKEFVNLSFHGMRAGKNPINVDIDLQLDPKVGEVTLTSEDFSRVILNLCNNAFDAMRDKLKTEDGRQKTEAYLPKLSVKTSLQKDKVLLSIADNGGGIPEEIKDKILQPFFTTKKGTEGTGLGLSITNDIIKAHGGGLEIETAINKGTNFTIKLNA